jgi:hypothetical protein
LPFQFDAGIQISIVMSESLEGVSVTATRQNGGSFAAAKLLKAPGSEKPPAATGCARVTVPPGSFSDVSDSQEPAATIGTTTRLPMTNHTSTALMHAAAMVLIHVFMIRRYRITLPPQGKDLCRLRSASARDVVEAVKGPQ